MAFEFGSWRNKLDKGGLGCTFCFRKHPAKSAASPLRKVVEGALLVRTSPSDGPAGRTLWFPTVHFKSWLSAKPEALLPGQWPVIVMMYKGKVDMWHLSSEGTVKPWGQSCLRREPYDFSGPSPRCLFGLLSLCGLSPHQCKWSFSPEIPLKYLSALQ